MANKIEFDVAIGNAFYFTGKNTLTIEEINSYIAIIQGLLPEGMILYGVSDYIKFFLERYGYLLDIEENLITINLSKEELYRYFIMRSYKSHLDICEAAANILLSVEEMSDEIETTDSMSLKKI